MAAYGAAAKGNTLLNFAGVRADLLPYVCDQAPSKQGKFMPGSHIPILAPSRLAADPPDFALILPWNIAQEVRDQNMALTDRGGSVLFRCAGVEVPVKSRILYTKPSITDLEVRYAADAAANG